MACWALLMTHAAPCTHPAARAAGGRWVAKGQRTSRLDSEVNTEGQLRSRPRSPLPFSAQPPWVLGASPGSGSCRTTESGSVCGHLAQTPSDTGTEKGVCPNSTLAPVNSLPVLCHLSPGFLISERFIMSHRVCHLSASVLLLALTGRVFQTQCCYLICRGDSVSGTARSPDCVYSPSQPRSPHVLKPHCCVQSKAGSSSVLK